MSANMNVFDFGPRADQLPGPEVLGTFDPYQLMAGTGGTAPLPGYADCLVRWFPHLPIHNQEERLVSSDIAAREQQIATTHEHLAAIQRESGYALLVPSHRSFAAPHPLNPDQPAVVSVVERVSGDAGHIWDPRSAASLYANATYLRWVIHTQQPSILADNFHHGQSLFAVPNIQTDIDCYLKPVDPVDYANYKMQRNYADPMEDWLRLLDRYRDQAPYVGRAATVLTEVQGMLRDK